MLPRRISRPSTDGIAAEARLPHVVADHHAPAARLACSSASTIGRPSTGGTRVMLKPTAVICAIWTGSADAAGNDQVAADGAERAELLDRLHLARHDESRASPAASRCCVDVPVLERDDAIAALDRQRRVELGVEEREEGGADADADRQARCRR